MPTTAPRTLVLALAAALNVCVAVSASGDERLTVLAELPMVGGPGDLEARRLGRDATMWLVAVTRTDVQSWRVGTVSEPAVSPGGGREPAFADFDGDGLLDLAVLRDGPGFNARPPIVVVLRGDGAGLFEERLTIPLDGLSFALAAADIDGDGNADLVLETALLDPSSPTLSTYRSLGAFRFDEPRRTTLGPPFYSVGQITAGDLDGDGRADVVSSRSDGNGSVSVWRNIGDGTFVASTVGLHADAPGPAILADLDRDGRLDLVYRDDAYFDPLWIEICRNDGGGRFTPSGRTEISFSSGTVAVADEDGDGVFDLLVRQGIAGRDSRISVFRGDGRGGFGPERRRILPAYAPLVPDNLLRPGPLVALDWDSDGVLDFVLMSELGPIVLGAEPSRHDVLFVPVLLSTTGDLETRFDSDLLLTNSGATTVRVELHYLSYMGGGSGAVTREIGPGEQLFAPSALGFLRDAGLPIDLGGPAIGTLRVEAFGGELPTSLSVMVRTTSPGGAGLSWAGVPPLDTLAGDSFVPWLVESGRDRTNLALVHAGRAEDGPITLRVTVESGDPATPGRAVLPDVDLAPGGFFQFPRALDAAGLASRLGWARISRVEGTARYLAWGAVNDAGSSDGAFVPAVGAKTPARHSRVVPSVIQSARYTTEIVVTNPEETPVEIWIRFPATDTYLEESLAPHQVFYLPDLFAEFRRRGLRGAPAADVPIAGPLYVFASPARRLLVGARVSAGASRGRYFGLFEPAVAVGSALGEALIVPDLRQDERLRTNLGLVNCWDSENSFRIEIHDGADGRLVATHDTKVLGRNEFLQLSSVLPDLAPSVRRGWARVIPKAPTTYFLAYGVIMDGAEPGRGTDDGSFVFARPE